MYTYWNTLSQHDALPSSAADRLKAAVRLYPCYETAEELELRRKVQLSQKKPPVYDRAALKLTDADRATLEAGGRRPHRTEEHTSELPSLMAHLVCRLLL